MLIRKEAAAFNSLRAKLSNFLKNFARVEISTLETEEVQSSICKAEHSTDRGDVGSAGQLIKDSQVKKCQSMR